MKVENTSPSLPPDGPLGTGWSFFFWSCVCLCLGACVFCCSLSSACVIHRCCFCSSWWAFEGRPLKIPVRSQGGRINMDRDLCLYGYWRWDSQDSLISKKQLLHLPSLLPADYAYPALLSLFSRLSLLFDLCSMLSWILVVLAVIACAAVLACHTPASGLCRPLEQRPSLRPDRPLGTLKTSYFCVFRLQSSKELLVTRPAGGLDRH